MTGLIDFFDLKDAQREAALVRDADVVVTAGAGSGKTRTLAARFITLLGEIQRPRALAAITFTEKAAREMRNRIRSEITAWRDGPCPSDARPLWTDLEAEIDTARIGTIHGLCAAILRAHPAEAAIDPRFEMLDEGDVARLRADVADRTAQWAGDQAEFGPLFAAFGADGLPALLVELIQDRLDAEVILARADAATAWQAIAWRKLQAFAEGFEVRGAAGELRELSDTGRLLADAGDKLTPQVLALLGHWDRFEAARAGGALWSALSAVFAVRRESGGGAGGKASRAKSAVRAIKDGYDGAINPWLGGAGKADPQPDPRADVAVAELVPLLARVFEHAGTAYRAEKDVRQVLDFDDLEQKAVLLLRNPGIRARWQSQIEALLVDEFQDTNSRQREIVEALAGTHDGRRGRVFIVGDAKQSIYRFRGADVSVFTRMSADITGRGGLAFALDRTYRAHTSLVAGINDLAAAALDGVAPGPTRIPFAALQPGRRTEARAAAPHIRFVAGLGETSGEGRAAAAAALAQELIALTRQGMRWDEMALLFRASTGFPVYEAAFEAAGVPFVTVAGRGFYDRPEIRDLTNVLAAIADPWDDLALTGALRSPMFGLSDAALYALRWPTAGGAPVSPWAALHNDLAALTPDDAGLARRAVAILTRLQAAVDRVSVADLLKRLLDETHYLAALAGVPGGARLRRNLEKLLADAHVSGATQLTGFLEGLEDLRDVGAREGEAPSDAGGAVRLLTVHKAKGLEFPVVVLADAGHNRRHVGGPLLLSPELGPVLAPPRVEARTLAYRLAMQDATAQEQAEEARLLYVAATRAQELLIVSGHMAKRGGDTWLKTLSAAAGVDLEALAAQPGVGRVTRLPCGEPVSAIVHATVELTPVVSLQQEVGAERSALIPLTTSVNPAPSRAAPQKPDQAGGPEWSHRMTRRLAHVDGTRVGQLVHEALRRWRFPGDVGFEALMSAAARSARLIDPEQAAPHLARAAELLERLRNDPDWIDLNAAHRDGRLHHELPYFQTGAGAGVIDLLYRDGAGQWQIVDFKTDTLLHPEDAVPLVAKDYGAQVRRYLQAAAALLDRPAQARLCWLDCAGRVMWQTIPIEPEEVVE